MINAVKKLRIKFFICIFALENYGEYVLNRFGLCLQDLL